LTIIADGDLDKAEFALLDELAVHELLGLEYDVLHTVVDTFYADLLSSKQLAWSEVCPVDERTLAELMGEIDDPALRRKVLSLCITLAEADGLVAEGESIVLVAAVEHWGLHRFMLRSAGMDLSTQGA
jgi:tellurite resistance protein